MRRCCNAPNDRAPPARSCWLMERDDAQLAGLRMCVLGFLCHFLTECLCEYFSCNNSLHFSYFQSWCLMAFSLEKFSDDARLGTVVTGLAFHLNCRYPRSISFLFASVENMVAAARNLFAEKVILNTIIF